MNEAYSVIQVRAGNHAFSQPGLIWKSTVDVHEAGKQGPHIFFMVEASRFRTRISLRAILCMSADVWLSGCKCLTPNNYIHNRARECQSLSSAVSCKATFTYTMASPSPSDRTIPLALSFLLRLVQEGPLGFAVCGLAIIQRDCS